MAVERLIIRDLGIIQYPDCHQMMKTYIEHKIPNHRPEIWLLEHPSILTQGQAGKPEHILSSNKTPCYQSDRGGQVTYHAPGQLICYFLINLKAFKLNAHALVQMASQLVVDILNDLGIESEISKDNPGVYTLNTSSNEMHKIASVGFRIRHQMSYHGIALNVDMNLKGFASINPCGLKNQKMSQIIDFFENKPKPSISDIKDLFIIHLRKALSPYTIHISHQWPEI